MEEDEIIKDESMRKLVFVVINRSAETELEWSCRPALLSACGFKARIGLDHTETDRMSRSTAN